MKLTTAILLLLPAVSAQDGDIYRTLSLGDRVQVTFRAGHTLTGTLKAVSPDPKVKIDSLDYTKEKVLTLDISWEYPGLNGTISIPKDQVAVLKKIQKLDDATLRRLAEEKERIKQQLDLDETDRKRAAEAADKAAAAAAKKAASEDKVKSAAGNEASRLIEEAQEMAKGLALLAKFPPPEWGPDRIKAIQKTSVLGIFPTAEETEFMESYEAWLNARRHQSKKAETDKAGEPSEEGKEEKK